MIIPQPHPPNPQRPWSSLTTPQVIPQVTVAMAIRALAPPPSGVECLGPQLEDPTILALSPEDTPMPPPTQQSPRGLGAASPHSKHLAQHLQLPESWPHLHLEEPQCCISTQQRHTSACTCRKKSGHLSHRPQLHQLDEERSPKA